MSAFDQRICQHGHTNRLECKVESLEAERDSAVAENARLLGQMAGLDNALIKKDMEIDRLKAELEQAKTDGANLATAVKQVTSKAETFESKANKLAEALRYYTNFQPHNGERVWSVGNTGSVAKEALAEFTQAEPSSAPKGASEKGV